MVDRMLAAGIPLVFSSRRPEVVGEVTSAGGRALPTPAEVAAASEVLITCLFSDSQLREVLFDQGVLAAMRPGAVLVNHVTGSPTLAREVAAAAPAGVGFLDAPVSGTAESIRRGELTVLVGGADEDLEHARPSLSTYASTILRVGDVGAAQVVKLLNNLLFTVHLGIAGEITRLGESMGAGRAGLVEALHHASGHSFALDQLAARPFDELGQLAGPYLRKDIASARQAAAEFGVDLGQLGELAGWVDD
jgi:3-hydroxyisobutyrate dehydrogenase-like beta-hydroxyacid dehydrogenase